MKRIEGSYNPENGIAYYFTSHGDQLRLLPNVEVNSSSNIHDDTPDHEQCSKRYPQISYGGYSYVFFWFCPLHGHCYGYHLISGSEGRKDPYSALYKYCETIPQEIFYDFSCSLSEYALNRAPELFKETRFFHDIFHGFSHKCSVCFKASRLCALGEVNSEICEQFNAFLKCIKRSATHLSQSHFCFFVQMFIWIWNCRKTDRFQNILNVAMAGCE